MKCQLIAMLWLASLTFGEPPRPHLYKAWPPRVQSLKNGPGMYLQLRGSGSTKIVSRLPAPNVFYKPQQSSMQFGAPSRIVNRPLKAAPSTHIYFKSPPSGQFKQQPFSSPSAQPIPGIFKFSSPAHKTAIKFKTPPPVPQHSKPDFVFEKVTLPKFAEPVLPGAEAAIHQIAAPNLSLNQLDSDLTKVSVQAFSIEKPIIAQTQHHPHHYQVQENINDYTVKNVYTGQNTLVAPDPNPVTFRGPAIHFSSDPLLNTPSDGKPKPADVLYHQNLEFNASPLVQQHFATDPFAFPVTSQPQLQQYHLQQNAMLQQGMPLAALNPTYLVMQSNNLLGQHQQHLTPQLFSPAHGYIDTSYSHRPATTQDYGKNYEVASLGQIYSAQKDLYHQLQDIATSTLSPSTAPSYHYDFSSLASQNVPAISQYEPKPVVNNYQHSHNNFIDYPEEQLSPNDIQHFLAYDDDAYRRQVENDQIIQEAHEKLKGKLELHKQQEQQVFDLHQLALGEKFNPLRFNPIVVPDEFQKRTDDHRNEDSYEEIDDEDSYEGIDPTTTDKPSTEITTAAAA